MKPEENLRQGAQTPSRWHSPDFQHSAGEAATRFVENRLGFKLHPWQRFILRHLFGQNFDRTKQIWKWAAAVAGVVIPRQNGKTFLIDIIILVGLFVFGERIVLTAQNRDTAVRSFLRIVELLDDPAHAALRKDVKHIMRRGGVEHIEMNNGGCFYVKTRGPDSARGLDAIDRLIMDEAYDVKESDLASVMPTVLASSNPQVCYFSTPPRKGVTGEPFARVRERGENREDGVAWFAWGLERKTPNEVIDTADRRLWAATNPSMNLPNGMPEENLAILHGSLSRDDFECECLGIWPLRADDKFIKPAAWEAVKDEESKRKGDVAIAVDTCGWGDDEMTSIALYGIRADGLGHLEIIDNRPGTDWVLKRLSELNEKHKPVAIGFDIKGPIGSLLIDLQKVGFKVPDDPEEPEYGDLAIPTATEFSPACVQFVSAVKEKTFRHRGQPQLTSAVMSGKTRKVGDSWGWDRYKSEADISPLVAATLARWAYETRAHLVQQDYDIEKTIFFG